MSLAEEAINKIMRDMINSSLSISGFAVREQESNAPRKKGSYAGVKNIMSKMIGQEQTTYSTNVDDLTGKKEGLRKVVYDLNFYRKNAIDYAWLVHTKIISELNRETFKNAGLGYVTRSDVRNLSQARENTWEERAQFDVEFHTIASNEELVRAIDIIGISGVYEINDRSENITITIE